MLREHFGDSTPIDSITTVHADEWRKAISSSEAKRGGVNNSSRHLAPATIAKRIRVAKAVFKKAVKWGLIPTNPFIDLRAGTQANPERAHYVDRDSIQSILDACPDQQWRAIIGLSRYAGLRCPSEVVALRWGDIHWDKGRMTVRSPKTAHHEGHASRIVPISPELRAILHDLFDQASVGEDAVVPRLRSSQTNLRTHFLRLIEKAGVKPWPRLFHNLRASCATDWAERFPSHVVAGWLGHSPLISAQHYLQTRDAHFNLAAGLAADCGTLPAVEAATKTATQVAKSDHRPWQAKTQNPRNPADLAGVGVPSGSVGTLKMTPMGFEPMSPP
ncbi:MAG: tyrosine-type recombinase/integrase [Phycisphaerales bacterium]